MKIEIKSRFDNKIILCGEYESVKDCLEKNPLANLSGANLSEVNLSEANLSRAYLSGANLSKANLSGAYLSGAYLSDIKNYSESREVFIQFIRNNLIKFSKEQQEIASRIFALDFCWKMIEKEYGKEMDKIFEILADLGWKEYKEKWESLKG